MAFFPSLFSPSFPAAEAAGAATLKDLAAAREQLATLNEALEQERKQSADKLAAAAAALAQMGAFSNG